MEGDVIFGDKGYMIVKEERIKKEKEEKEKKEKEEKEKREKEEKEKKQKEKEIKERKKKEKKEKLEEQKEDIIGIQEENKEPNEKSEDEIKVVESEVNIDDPYSLQMMSLWDFEETTQEKHTSKELYVKTNELIKADNKSLVYILKRRNKETQQSSPSLSWKFDIRSPLSISLLSLWEAIRHRFRSRQKISSKQP
jgi:hypothetical protein